jgi:hypothetical protein
MNPLPPGKTILVMGESPSGAGSLSRIFTLDSDTFQTSLFVSSISGSLTITLSTITGEGKEKEVITCSPVTSPSTQLDLKRAATAMGVIKATAVFTGACSFELRAKGLSNGQMSATIQSATTAKASQINITGTPAILLPAALIDRKGVIIKNNGNGTHILYLGFSQAQASTGTGYPIGKGEALALDVAPGAVLWAVSGNNTIDVRIIEAGG